MNVVTFSRAGRQRQRWLQPQRVTYSIVTTTILADFTTVMKAWLLMEHGIPSGAVVAHMIIGPPRVASSMETMCITARVHRLPGAGAAIIRIPELCAKTHDEMRASVFMSSIAAR